MAGNKKAEVTLPTDERILIMREFDAPRQQVYRAWTGPELVERWWGGERGEVTSAWSSCPVAVVLRGAMWGE